MAKLQNAIRILAAVVAICSLAWLVDNVNAHAIEIQQGLANAMDRPIVLSPGSRDVHGDDRIETIETGGIDIIDVCYFGPPSGIEGWVGLWFVTLLIGGLPTAILLHPAGRNTRGTHP